MSRVNPSCSAAKCQHSGVRSRLGLRNSGSQGSNSRREALPSSMLSISTRSLFQSSTLLTSISKVLILFPRDFARARDWECLSTISTFMPRSSHLLATARQMPKAPPVAVLLLENQKPFMVIVVLTFLKLRKCVVQERLTVELAQSGV